MKVIKWAKVARPDEAWNFRRGVCRADAPIIMHAHDFYEVFWIEEGSGFHILNGQKSALAAGALMFIRPEDRHEFHQKRDRIPFTLANFAVPAATGDAYRKRWQAYDLRKIPWLDAGIAWDLTTTQLAAIGSIARSATDGACTALAGDRFLSGLMHELHREPSLLHPGAEAPEWLFRAVAKLHESDQLLLGVEGFFRAAGRSREHVARACQRYLHLTPTDLVNRLRLEHAVRLLEQTDLTVLEVGAAAGFGNPSLFHRRFRSAYGSSPRQYRHQRQRALPS